MVGSPPVNRSDVIEGSSWPYDEELVDESQCGCSPFCYIIRVIVAAPDAVMSPLLGFILGFRRTIFARKSCAKSFANRIGHWTVAVFFALSIARPVAADVRIEEN
jgi:hypothetical protein